MANPVAAIVGADQPDTGLIIGRERNIARSKAPGLIAEANAFALSASGASKENASVRGLIASIGCEGTRQRKAETAARYPEDTDCAIPRSENRVLRARRG
jgi:hypothetical protein